MPGCGERLRVLVSLLFTVGPVDHGFTLRDRVIARFVGFILYVAVGCGACLRFSAALRHIIVITRRRHDAGDRDLHLRLVRLLLLSEVNEIGGVPSRGGADDTDIQL